MNCRCKKAHISISIPAIFFCFVRGAKGNMHSHSTRDPSIIVSFIDDNYHDLPSFIIHFCLTLHSLGSGSPLRPNKTYHLMMKDKFTFIDRRRCDRILLSVPLFLLYSIFFFFLSVEKWVKFVFLTLFSRLNSQNLNKAFHKEEKNN